MNTVLVVLLCFALVFGVVVYIARIASRFTEADLAELDKRMDVRITTNRRLKELLEKLLPLYKANPNCPEAVELRRQAYGTVRQAFDLNRAWVAEIKDPKVMRMVESNPALMQKFKENSRLEDAATLLLNELKGLGFSYKEPLPSSEDDAAHFRGQGETAPMSRGSPRPTMSPPSIPTSEPSQSARPPSRLGLDDVLGDLRPEGKTQAETSQRAVFSLAFKLEDILREYVAIRDDAFKPSIRRLLLVPGVFEEIHFRSHHAKLTKLQADLQSIIVSGRALRSAKVCTPAEHEFLAEVHEYATALSEAIVKLSAISFRLQEKSEGRCDYSWADYRRDVADYETAANAYQQLGTGLNKRFGRLQR